MRPNHHPPDVSMFHETEMNVIGLAGKVSFVAQRALPIAALPNAGGMGLSETKQVRQPSRFADEFRYRSTHNSKISAFSAP